VKEAVGVVNVCLHGFHDFCNLIVSTHTGRVSDRASAAFGGVTCRELCDTFATAVTTVTRPAMRVFGGHCMHFVGGGEGVIPKSCSWSVMFLCVTHCVGLTEVAARIALCYLLPRRCHGVVL
jgi:hypothetical protein